MPAIWAGRGRAFRALKRQPDPFVEELSVRPLVGNMRCSSVCCVRNVSVEKSPRPSNRKETAAMPAEVSLSCRVNRGRRKHGGTNSARLSAAGEFTGLEGEGARTSLTTQRLRVVVRLLHS